MPAWGLDTYVNTRWTPANQFFADDLARSILPLICATAVNAFLLTNDQLAVTEIDVVGSIVILLVVARRWAQVFAPQVHVESVAVKLIRPCYRPATDVRRAAG